MEKVFKNCFSQSFRNIINFLKVKQLCGLNITFTCVDFDLIEEAFNQDHKIYEQILKVTLLLNDFFILLPMVRTYLKVKLNKGN